MALLFPAGYQFFNAAGKTVASGTVTFYETGTTTLKTVYTNRAMTVAGSNPFSLDSSGRLSQNIYGTGLYTILVKQAAGATVWSRDDVFGWTEAEESLTSDIEVTVGTGGDYDTVGEALSYLQTLKRTLPSDGTSIQGTVRLLTGFNWAEQVAINNMDLGWITIISDDATVDCARSALTVSANQTDFAGDATLPNRKYAIFGYNGTTLPRWGIKLDMDTSGSTSATYVGILLHAFSSICILDGCGVINVVKPGDQQSGRGINVTHGSFATGWGSVWTGCHIGVRVANSSKASVRECDASGCDYAIDVNGASEVSCQDSTLTGCTYHALWASGKAVIKASGSDCSGTGTGGVDADYSAIYCDDGDIDADGCDVSGSGRGITVEGGGEVRFNTGIADAILGNGLTTIGVNSSIVARAGALITDGLSGSGAVAQYGSQIDVSGSSVTGWTGNGLYAVGGKIVAYDTTVTGNDAAEDLRVSEGGEIYAYGTTNTTNGGGTAVAVADTNVSRLNDRTTDGVIYTSAASILNGSKTHDFGNLADGAGETTTVTVTGAALGDFVEGVSLSVDTQGILLSGWVSATDTVSVRAQNETGGAIDLASATLRVRVRKA